MSKRALIIGINNFVQASWRLRGCINDTVEMQTLLKTYYGFGDAEIRVMHDRDADGDAIRRGLRWLLSEYAGGGQDVRVLHFSSHGTQVADQGDDEWERKDEVIVPYDHDWAKPFRDDELRTFFDEVPDDVNFTFVADCCHSGSMQRAAPEIEFYPRYLYPPTDVERDIERLQTERDAAKNAYIAAQMAQMLQGVPPAEWPQKMQEYLALLEEQFKRENYAVVPYERHFLLAACEDRQTAADARIAGEFRGAFTWGLGQAIREASGDLTYAQAIARAANKLQRYDQRPQLECPSALADHKLFAPMV